MNTSTLLMIVVAFITSFGACISLAATPPAQADTSSPMAASGTPAANKDMVGLWLLGSASHLPSLPTGVTLSIRKETSSVNPSALHLSGFTGLNYYVSDALIDPTQQRFVLSSKLAATEKWGDQGEMKFEKAYLDALDGVVRYTLASAQNLTLTTLNGDTLQFHKISN